MVKNWFNDFSFLSYLFGSIGSWHWRWTVLCWFGQRWNLPNWRWQKSTSSWIHSWWTADDCFGWKKKANETYSCQSSGPTYRYRMDQSGWHQKLFDFCHWSHAGRTRRYVTYFWLKILFGNWIKKCILQGQKRFWSCKLGNSGLRLGCWTPWTIPTFWNFMIFFDFRFIRSFNNLQPK